MPNHRPRRCEAFTLIEMSVIIIVLALLAATVVPRLMAYERGSAERSFLTRLPALALEARTSAISTGQSVTLTYSDADHRFGLQRESEEEGQTRFASPEYAEVEATRVGEEETEGGDWSVRFYSDGTSDGGGIQFSFDGRHRSFMIDRRSGASAWQDGELPDTSNDRWPAGELEIRGEGSPRR